MTGEPVAAGHEGAESLILAEARITYRAPVFHTETVTVETHATVTGWAGDRHGIERTVQLPADRITPLVERVQREAPAMNDHAHVERAKPYVVVRQVTIITLATLVLVAVLSPTFFAPYKTPVGQVMLAVLAVAYAGSLVLMRRRARQQARARILVRESP